MSQLEYFVEQAVKNETYKKYFKFSKGRWCSGFLRHLENTIDEQLNSDIMFLPPVVVTNDLLQFNHQAYPCISIVTLRIQTPIANTASLPKTLNSQPPAKKPSQPLTPSPKAPYPFTFPFLFPTQPPPPPPKLIHKPPNFLYKTHELLTRPIGNKFLPQRTIIKSSLSLSLRWLRGSKAPSFEIALHYPPSAQHPHFNPERRGKIMKLGMGGLTFSVAQSTTSFPPYSPHPSPLPLRY